MASLNETGYQHNIEEELKKPYIILFLTITGISAVIGVIGNTLTICTFCLTQSLQETRNSFIVNLAVADIMVAGIVMPFNMFGVIAGRAYFDERKILCAFLATVCAPGCLVSMYTIGWIGCTRYMYICKYGLYNRFFTQKNTILSIGSIWVFCFLIHSPNHIGWGSSKYSTGFKMCTLDMEELSYSFFYGCCMIIAIVVTFLFYFQIYKTIRKSNLAKKMVTGVANNGFVNKLDQPIVSLEQQQNGPSEINFQNEIKIARTSFKIFIVFVVTWTPTAILTLMGINDNVPEPVYLFSIFLAHSNSTLNFFIYYIDNKIFKNSLSEIFKKVFKRSSYVSDVASKAAVVKSIT